jgi:hypothetical protein
MMTRSHSLFGDEVDLDGYFDEPKQVRYIGKAKRIYENQYQCLAVVGGSLCLVEATITNEKVFANSFTPEIKSEMKSVLQDWVMTLGLRQQGTLLSGIRGCDTVPKHHITKLLVRGLRADCLNAFCGDPKKSGDVHQTALARRASRHAACCARRAR